MAPGRATLAFTPDSSSVLFSANISGQLNLWRLPADGGWPDQLTSFEDRTVRSVGVAPDGTIGFTADRNGDEFYQLYAIEAGGGWPVAWTDSPQVQHYPAEGAGWDPSGRRLAFAANAREPADMEVWLREVATGEVRHVFGEGRYVWPVSFSPNGEALLCRELRGEDDQRLHLVDLVTGDSRALTSREEQAKHAPGPWAGDGSGFWVATDRGREYSGLAFFDLGSGELRWAETPEWDVTEVAGDRAGTVLVWLVNEDGWGRLHGRDLRTGRPLPAADLPAGCGDHHGTALAVSDDGRYAALPGYWAAAVGICTAGNLLTWAKAVPPTWRRFMAREVGDPETEADFLTERSPITYAAADPGRAGPAGGEIRGRPAGRAVARARPTGGVRGLRRRGPRVHPAGQLAARDAAHRRLVHPPPAQWIRLALLITRRHIRTRQESRLGQDR